MQQIKMSQEPYVWLLVGYQMAKQEYIDHTACPKSKKAGAGIPITVFLLLVPGGHHFSLLM
jgi:hypothetical protein